MTRTASCSCASLTVACDGEPTRISVCHCLACQRRTGSAFGSAAFFPAEAVTVAGESNTWTRAGEDGPGAIFHHCPTCGATVFWEPLFKPGFIAVAVGAFADPTFPPPEKQVYGETRHPWVAIEGVVED
ncbi:MAG TPA: GFA family protein [Caulobacter sp.]|nr:GFA family protein [Caulobacter sp.]